MVNEKINKYWNILKLMLPAWVLLVSVLLVGVLSFFIYRSNISEIVGAPEYELVVALLVIVNFLLVTFNTVIFILDTLKASEFVDKAYLDDLSSRNYDRTKKKFLLYYFFTLLISVGIPCGYILQILGTINADWEILFFVSELAALSMFLLFILADSSIKKLFEYSKTSNTKKKESFDNLYSSLQGTPVVHHQVGINATKELINKNLDEIENDIRFLKYAIPLIDITGFIGIFLIFVLTKLIFNPYAINDGHIYYVEHLFGEGFAIGAIAFHIFFTQLNFVILKVLDKVK